MKPRHPHAVAIGKRVVKARAALGYDLEQLALKAGIGVYTVRRIESGTVLAYSVTLQKLAPVLNVEQEWLEMGNGKGPTMDRRQFRGVRTADD